MHYHAQSPVKLKAFGKLLLIVQTMTIIIDCRWVDIWRSKFSYIQKHTNSIYKEIPNDINISWIGMRRMCFHSLSSPKFFANQPMIACASVDSFYIQTINKAKVQDKAGADHTAHEQVVDPFGVLPSEQFDDVKKERDLRSNIEFDENGARRKKTQYGTKPRISKGSSMSVKSITHFANAHISTIILLMVAV